MNITVIGAGYVGFSTAVLLSKYFNVTVLEKDNNKIKKINTNKSPLDEEEITTFLNKENLKLKASNNKKKALLNADIIFCCLPTDFNEQKNQFETDLIVNFAEYSFNINPNGIFVVKSTVPIGFIERLNKAVSKNIIFVPEFLREGSALRDNLYPSRVVIGFDKTLDKKKIMDVEKVLLKPIKSKKIDVLRTSTSEAEAIKLFSNSYLAMRVGFFNEIDTFALNRGLSSKRIIQGISADNRIGNHYNNPSFGYGGYCLPKDSKQALSSFKRTPQSIFSAIVASNDKRIDYMKNQIYGSKKKNIGFYRLIMKKDSDNFRSSSSSILMKRLIESGSKITLYEPLIETASFMGAKVEKNLEEFLKNSDIIVANRFDQELSGCGHKVFTRDIFEKDT